MTRPTKPALPEFLYFPDDKSEDGPVYHWSEAQHFTTDDLQTAKEAEQVMSLEDNRGHYLQADFLYYVTTWGNGVQVFRILD